MKSVKKILCVLLAILTFCIVPSVNVTAVSMFDGEEEYYYNYCTAMDLSEEDEEVCDAFYAYMSDQSDAAAKELESITQDLNNVKKDISKLQSALNSLSNQIKQKNTSITSTTKSIATLETNIALLEKQIQEREEDIASTDEGIRARMEAIQSIIQVNAFADFIMGATDFVDLIRRVEGVNSITSYDKEQIKKLEEQKALLVKDRDILVKQKETAQNQKTDLEKQKSSLVSTQNTQQALLAEYNLKAAEIEAQQQQAAQNLSEIKRAVSDLSSLRTLTPSTGWIYPVDNFYISAGSFYYPASFCSAGANKCPHLGTDFAANVGTPVYAPANSVVLFMSDRCPTYGGLGNWCGTPGSAGAGNHVVLAMVVDGKTYAVKIGHMVKGVSKYIEWPSKDGKAVTVLQGTQIGEVGSSGNSSGPHSHIEVFYFGTTPLVDVIEEFSNKGQFDFGLGWGSAGLTTTCNKKNYKAPCRYNPLEIWNVKVGKSYSL
ncbi:MAG: peptidoglycan DD-metalloendopeptidase family protein [Erysipelotrichales bacterium]|nr:peptidoglycan DD-metalloendopeptidase family protein [Erysipelotrichales bacterium]